jgi:hypothetical protein
LPSYFDGFLGFLPSHNAAFQGFLPSLHAVIFLFLIFLNNQCRQILRHLRLFAVMQCWQLKVFAVI